MSKSTISTFELFQMFPDNESARLYFEAKRWPEGAVCPACGEAKRIGTRKGGFYRCNACLTDFTIRTGTVFERSKVPHSNSRSDDQPANCDRSRTAQHFIGCLVQASRHVKETPKSLHVAMNVLRRLPCPRMGS